MSPSFWRVAAGACMVAAGLLAGSGAVALAAPDSNSDSNSSQSHNPGVNRQSGTARGNSSNAGTASASRSRVALGAARRSGLKDRQPPSVVSSTGPTASAVASTAGPTASAVASAAQAVNQAVSSATSTVRQTSQTAAAARASTPTVSVTPNTTVSSALAPLTSIVENVSSVVIGPKAAHTLVDAANQFIDGVMTANPNLAPAAPAGPPNNAFPLRMPGIQRVDPASDLQTLSQPAPMLPGRSLMTVSTGMPTSAAGTTSGVITPQLLSNQLPVNASTQPANTPTATPTDPNWFSGIASQIFHGVREALRNVSLTELALAALPGVAGLLFFFATGVGLGRRQAKFGFAMASSGAMRFAVRGPLGVVRNGSSVAVHSRKKTALSKAIASSPTDDRPPRGRHLRLIDRVA